MKLELLHKASAPLVRLHAEHLPLMMHLGIGLKLRTGLRLMDPVFHTAGIQVLHYDAVETFLLQFRSDCYQEEIQSVILYQ